MFMHMQSSINAIHKIRVFSFLFNHNAFLFVENVFLSKPITCAGKTIEYSKRKCSQQQKLFYLTWLIVIQIEISSFFYYTKCSKIHNSMAFY